MRKIVRISGCAMLFYGSDDIAVEREIARQTRDMDSVVRIEERPRTGDSRSFIVIGTPH